MAGGHRRADPDLATGERQRGPFEAGELHRLLVERVQDYAIFALDRRLHPTWNASAERLKGYRPEEAIGRLRLAGRLCEGGP